MATRKSPTKRAKKSETNGMAEHVVKTPDAPQATGSNGTANPSPALEQIRLRAYEIFIARGGTHGDDWRDWFIAEQELSGPSSKS